MTDNAYPDHGILWVTGQTPSKGTFFVATHSGQRIDLPAADLPNVIYALTELAYDLGLEVVQ